MIKRRTMGRTGLKFSELSLGTLNFGWKTDQKTAFAVLDAYHAAGGNVIQATSHSPGLLLPSAAATLSEEIVGRWWRSRRLQRKDFFLLTRLSVRQPSGAGAEDFRKVVYEACRDSLRRFQTDYLDMVIFEWNEALVPIRATLEAFDHVVRRGLVRYIGAANFPVWRVVDSLGRAYLRNHSRMEALQADYSLITRARFEPEVMALSQEHRLGFFAQSPLAGGFLAHRHDIETLFDGSRRGWLMEKFGNAYGLAAQAVVADVAARHATSSAQVALSWVLHNPAVTSAVIGVHSVEQLRELLAATSLSLSASDLEQLDQATAAEEIRLETEIDRVASASASGEWPIRQGARVPRQEWEPDARALESVV
ncbi:MAG TPA: aldo/keto reductase [Opitutaceae bacterium]